MKKMRDAYRVLVERRKEKIYIEEQGVDGIIILKWNGRTQT